MDDAIPPNIGQDGQVTQATIWPSGGSPDVMELDDLHNGEIHPEGLSKNQDINEVDRLPGHSDLDSHEDCVLDQFPEVSEDTLPDIDLILKECQDLTVLKHYVTAFEESFQRTGKMDDLDRKIHALRGILQLTSEQGLTDNDEDHYDTLLFNALAERCSPTKSALENRKRKPENDGFAEESRKQKIEDVQFPSNLESSPHDEISILDLLPEMSKDTLTDMNFILKECKDLTVLEYFMDAFEDRFQWTVTESEILDGLHRKILVLREILQLTPEQGLADADRSRYHMLLTEVLGVRRIRYPMNFTLGMDVILSGRQKTKDDRFRGYSTLLPHSEAGILDQFPEVSEDTLSDIDLILGVCQDPFVLEHYFVAFTLRFSRDRKMEDLDRRIHVLRSILQFPFLGTDKERFYERQLLFALCARHHIKRAMDDGDKIGVVARRMLERDPHDRLALISLEAVLMDQARHFQAFSIPEQGDLRREIACLEEILDRFLRDDSPSRWMKLLRLSFIQSVAMVSWGREYNLFDSATLDSLKQSFEELWNTKHWNLIDERVSHLRSSIRRMFHSINMALYAITQGSEYLGRFEEIEQLYSDPEGSLEAKNNKSSSIFKGAAFLARHRQSHNLKDLRSSARYFELGDTSTHPLFQLQIYNILYQHYKSRDDAERCKTFAQLVLKHIETDERRTERVDRKLALHEVVKGLINHFRSDCPRNAESLRKAAKLVFCKELRDGTTGNWERLGILGHACCALFDRTRYIPTVHFGIAFLRLSVEGLRAAGLRSSQRALLYTQYLATALFTRHVYLQGWTNSGLPLMKGLNENLLPAIIWTHVTVMQKPIREVDIFQTTHHDRGSPGASAEELSLELILALAFFNTSTNDRDGDISGEDEWFSLMKDVVETYRDPSFGWLRNTLGRLSALTMYAHFCFSHIGRLDSLESRERFRVLVSPLWREAISVLQLFLTSQPFMRSLSNIMRSENAYGTDVLSVPLMAAYYAIEFDEIQSAVEYLEYGRSLLWSRMRGLRTAESELQGVDEDLKNRFVGVCEELEKIVTVDAQPDPLTMPVVRDNVHSTITDTSTAGSVEEHPSQTSDKFEKKRRLDRELELVVEKIRETPGYEFFLQMTPFHKLRSAAREGPVIILTMCTEVVRLPNFGLAQAIIVLESQEPIVVSLGENVNLKRILTSINRRLQEIRQRPGESNDKLMAVLKDIGEHVVKEIVATLISLDVEEQSRIWWCPTSIFSEFPIHAAIWQDQTEEGKTRLMCLSDIYISSYTPTLTALIHARSPTSIGNKMAAESVGAVSRSSMLVVKQLDEQLASVDQEVGNIKSVAWKAGHTLESLNLYTGEAEDEQQKILHDLPQSRWIHFACHGILNNADPFLSHFQVGSGKITLMDILKSKVPNAELAFLSACHSAGLPGDIAKDESLHLAAAMQFCGFRSVVGTMWPLNDEDGPRVAKAFYEYMFAEPKEGEDVGHKRSARALNRVIQKMRRHPDYKQTPERWVNFVHIGA